MEEIKCPKCNGGVFAFAGVATSYPPSYYFECDNCDYENRLKIAEWDISPGIIIPRHRDCKGQG